MSQGRIADSSRMRRKRRKYLTCRGIDIRGKRKDKGKSSGKRSKIGIGIAS